MIRAALSAMFLCCAFDLSAQDAPVVAIDSGRVRGEWVEVGPTKLMAFRGIPFAAPQVGELRWRPPQKVEAWQDERLCTEFAPACPQPKELSYGVPFRKQSEDCLYLNLWTAAPLDAKPRAVMVWIHGGGNLIGGAGSPFYDGRFFAVRGVVLVTIQYRLGVFGWLAHPALSAEAKLKDGVPASGNYGLMDQIAALQWVQRNIAKFGGDPSCVTIFGESAGATDVSLLLTSPLAAGLFHRAIAESGGFNENTPSLQKGSGLLQPAVYATARGIAHRFDIEDDDEDALSKLRALTVEQILSVPVSIGTIGNAEPGDRAARVGPCVDGLVLPHSPEAVWREGRMHKVPLIAGSLLDDGSVFSRTAPIRRLTGYRMVVRALFAGEAERVLELFPAADDAAVPDAVHRLITTMSFTAPARRLCRWMNAAGGDAFLYQFTRDPHLRRGNEHQVVHGAEIPYVFGVLAERGDAVDRALSDQIMQRFVSFARDGDPNPKGLEPTWPKHDQESDRHLEYGDAVVVRAGLEREACDLFDGVSARR